MPQDDRRGAARTPETPGDDMLGVSLDDPAACQQLAEQLRRTGNWLEAVAGVDSVVVQFDAARTDLDAARDRFEKQLAVASGTVSDETPLVEIPVCYGGEFGPDFAALCTSLGLSAEALIELHTADEYQVDMLGFTPGFAYVGGLPDELNVPRRARPRQRVAAGSVGIADGRTGLYALPGPGGWSLIGRTPMPLFDAKAEEPFLLHAGARVRFYAVDAGAFPARVDQ